MVITICGSTKFKNEMLNTAKELTLNGNIVLMPFVFTHCDDEITDEQRLLLYQLHFKKIEMSDAIFVVNVDNYIGESTKNEIKYAKKLGKIISYLVDGTSIGIQA